MSALNLVIQTKNLGIESDESIDSRMFCNSEIFKQMRQCLKLNHRLYLVMIFFFLYIQICTLDQNQYRTTPVQTLIDTCIPITLKTQ